MSNTVEEVLFAHQQAEWDRCKCGREYSPQHQIDSIAIELNVKPHEVSALVLKSGNIYGHNLEQGDMYRLSVHTRDEAEYAAAQIATHQFLGTPNIIGRALQVS